jgi:ferredoxin--NADP+ reductase
MREDVGNDIVLTPTHPRAEDAEAFIRERQPLVFTYADWRTLNQIEVSRGGEMGRPRVKFTRVEDMLAALHR